jgi:hypothetical protein
MRRWEDNIKMDVTKIGFVERGLDSSGSWPVSRL